MKQHAKWFAGVLAVASGLMIVNSAQAQYTATTLSDFQNFNLSVTYANWDASGWQIINGGDGIMAPVITSGATPGSYQVNAGGYGSGAYNFGSPINAAGATKFQFTFTLNTATPPVWMNPQLTISDGTHQVNMHYTGGPWMNYGNYGTGTYTLTGDLTDQLGGLPLDPSTVTAFNIGWDPAGNIAGNIYDVTYGNLSLLTPVPEPTTLALVAMGAVGLVIARRRGSVS
jgi:hypothetical protein